MIENSYRILICDDEEGTLILLKRWFEKFSGFEVVTFADGLSAQNYLLKHKVDMVITDVRMPFVDGLELIKQIRQSANDCPVIIISGYDDFNYARLAMQYGVKDYLLKPIDLNELQVCVMKCCEETKQHRIQWFKSDYYKYESLENLVNDSIKKGKNDERCIMQLNSLQYKNGIVFQFMSVDEKQYHQEELSVVLRNLLADIVRGGIVLNVKYIGEGISYLIFNGNELQECCPKFIEEYVNRVLPETFEVQIVKKLETAEAFMDWALKQEVKSVNIHITKAIQYMEAHIGDSVTRDDVAKFVGFSPSYFSRVFQNVTGKGYNEYLIDMRIEKAKKMLMENCKIKDVSQKLAFQDARYFSRVFQKKTGYLPSEYQEKILSKKQA